MTDGLHRTAPLGTTPAFRPARRSCRTITDHLHELRHSYATGALKAGVSPKVVSERIGHANVGFFLQTYAHVLGNDDRDAAEQAAAFLIGKAWDPADDGLLVAAAVRSCRSPSAGRPGLSTMSVSFRRVLAAGADERPTTFAKTPLSSIGARKNRCRIR
jgi:hypothetical protein